MADVGTSVKEGVANGGSPFQDPAKRNIGLLGMFTRGALLTPIRVVNMEEFNETFGGQNSNYYGPAVVKNLFDEAGEAPATLYIARVAASDAKAAKGTINSTGENKPAFELNATAAYRGVEDPGSWANNKVKVTVYPYSVSVEGNYVVTVEYDGTVETYTAPTLAEIQKQILQVSKFAVIDVVSEPTGNARYGLKAIGTFTADQGATTLTGSATPTGVAAGDTLYSEAYEKIGVVKSIEGNNIALEGFALVAVTGQVSKLDTTAPSATLSAGSNGGEVTEEYFGNQFSCFDGVDVQIIAHTEFHSLSVEKKLNAYLNDQKSPVGVITFPNTFSEALAELYCSALKSNDKSFMAGAYAGWVTVLDADGNRIKIPNIGAILGAGYLRTPYVNGDGIHIPPGGIDSLFTTVLDCSVRNLTQPQINRLVQQFYCNVLQYVDGTGFYIGSSRAYSSNKLYQSIHVRLQTSYYVRLLRVRMRFAEQKPNTPDLKREILIECRRIFKPEYEVGALENSVSFEKAYQAICDKSNNPASQDRKIVNVTIMWIPTECTESIVVSLQRNDGILILEEE